MTITLYDKNSKLLFSFIFSIKPIKIRKEFISKLTETIEVNSFWNSFSLKNPYLISSTKKLYFYKLLSLSLDHILHKGYSIYKRNPEEIYFIDLNIFGNKNPV